MSSQYYNVVKHEIPCQHVREYMHATKSTEDDTLQLAIKQYIPRDFNSSDSNAVTIIGTCGTGFPKEVYEPLWDELLNFSKTRNFSIRGIWVADMSNQGASGVLNENIQGDDPSGFDHSRDLLHIINTFRASMPRPIVGIGHSLGAAQLVHLSITHPRLFATLLLLDPMIQADQPAGLNAAQGASFKPDLWLTRAAAESALRSDKFLKTLDPRALNNVVKHGLRPVPTALHPLSDTLKTGAYTLTTSKHQEAWSYKRPAFRPRVELKPDEPPSREERLLAPDVDHRAEGKFLSYRPEMRVAFEYLPFVRPSVLYVFGGRGRMSTPELRAAKMERTGTGLGGSGGKSVGRVKEVVFEKWFHLFPLEHLRETAGVMAAWLAERVQEWEWDEEFLAGYERGKSSRGMLEVSQEWKDKARLPQRAERMVLEKGKL
ncbi:MAG: hypothetical protein MMC23_004275 [Stictis urceolatum]|nr:hypothetical protein [Stictis urceolata]